MKRTLLAVSLLLSAPMLADNFATKKSELDAAQAGVDSAERRVSELSTQLETGRSQVSTMAGKPEYASEVERLNEANRKLAEECNRAVADCKAENARLQEAVSRCTGMGHKVVNDGGRYSLEKHEPTVAEKTARPATTTRQPYAQRGNVYPRTTAE